MAKDVVQTKLEDLLTTISKSYKVSEDDAFVVLGALLAVDYGEEDFYDDVATELEENGEDYS
jgi:hypothetical protein